MEKTLSIGSISHGTMRTQDLIPTFLDVLEEVDKAKAEELCAEVPAEAWEDDDHEYWDSEEADYLLNEDLWEALDAHCPDYCYFGAHEGDGSDYGCWPSWDAIEDGVRSGELVKVEDLAEVPEGWAGMVLLIDDHGNATLYRPRVEFDEVWAIV